MAKIEEQYSMNTVKGDTIKVKASLALYEYVCRAPNQDSRLRTPLHSCFTLSCTIFPPKNAAIFFFQQLVQCKCKKEGELSWVLHTKQSSVVVYRQQPLQKMVKSKTQRYF